MAEIPYKVGPFSRAIAPKGKIPFIHIDGKYLGDSQLIIEELERRLRAEGKPALDDGLSDRDHATARFVRRAIEEGSYFVGMYARWKTDEGYAVIREEFKKFVPSIAIGFIRRDINKKLHHQGTGRHTYEEAAAMGSADYDAMAELLGDRPFILGDKPRTVDAALFGFIEATLGPPFESPIKTTAMSHANLVAYRKRIRERWWKDLPALA
jgi:glutathione S-transferase